MTITYPTALDVFTNPTAGDALNAASVPHATQHADANDAIEALEAKVGIGASTPVANRVLAGTGVGVSGWSASPTLTGLILTAGLTVSAGGAAITGNSSVTAGNSHALTVNGGTTGSVLVLAGGTITAAYRLIDASLTWNSGGTGFQAVVVNVTDTASSAASQLLALQINSGTIFSVRKDGVVTAASKLFPGTDGGTTQTAAGLYAGTGAPNNANGANGDFYFRSDGGALTALYQRRAGAWVGII